MKKQNPKLEGSGLIDCIPQKGYCPNKCPECYYNNGFFLDLFEELPLMPTIEEIGNKIVRVNSGNDSNIEKDLVLKETEIYQKKFYNTSIPDFNFPGPVVFTVNGGSFGDTTEHWKQIKTLCDFGNLNNIMFVRYKTNTWNLGLLDQCVEYFANENNIPVVLTFMRYKLYENVENIEDYEIRKSIINTYWCIKEEAFNKIVEKYENNELVDVCGGKTYGNSYCKSCRNCEKYYNKFILKG